MTLPITRRQQNTSKRLTLAEKLLIKAEEGNASSLAASRKYGVSDSTVRAIWKDKRLCTRASEVALIKETMADELLLVANAALKQTSLKLPETSASQAMVIAAIGIDKARLINNESTANHSVNVWLDMVNNVPVDDKYNKV